MIINIAIEYINMPSEKAAETVEIALCEIVHFVKAEKVSVVENHFDNG